MKRRASLSFYMFPVEVNFCLRKWQVRMCYGNQLQIAAILLEAQERQATSLHEMAVSTRRWHRARTLKPPYCLGAADCKQ